MCADILVGDEKRRGIYSRFYYNKTTTWNYKLIVTLMLSLILVSLFWYILFFSCSFSYRIWTASCLWMDGICGCVLWKWSTCNISYNLERYLVRKFRSVWRIICLASCYELRCHACLWKTKLYIFKGVLRVDCNAIINQIKFLSRE